MRSTRTELRRSTFLYGGTDRTARFSRAPNEPGKPPEGLEELISRYVREAYRLARREGRTVQAITVEWVAPDELGSDFLLNVSTSWAPERKEEGGGGRDSPTRDAG